jgi:hypothetical protein
MLNKRIIQSAAAVCLGISAIAAAPSPANATSTYKAGLTAIRVTKEAAGPWTVTERLLPQIVIANDLVLLPDPTLYRTQQFLPKMVTGPVSVQQRLDAGMLLGKSGVLNETFDIGADAGPFPPGADTTLIELTVDGVDRRIVAPALGTRDANLPTMTKEQRSNRKTLTKVIASLTSTSRWGVNGTAFFRPTEYAAWGMKLAVSPNSTTASTFDLSMFTTDMPRCIAVPAKLAEAIPPTAQRWLEWKGGVYEVVLRPVLPGEVACR